MVQLCRINLVRARFCEDSLKYALYKLIFASQDIIQFLEDQINYIFSQKTLVSLVPQISRNQGLLKSSTKPEQNVIQLIQRMTFRSTLIMFGLCLIFQSPLTGRKLQFN